MIVGRDHEVDGHYVGTRMLGFVLPGGAFYVNGASQTAIRLTSGMLWLGIARVWIPLAALAWPLLFGLSLHTGLETVVLLISAAMLHRPLRLDEDEKRPLRLLGSQTGLRIEPSRLLPTTRKAKLEMLEALMTKGGLARDAAWLIKVVEEIPGPALPLVYAYARYAGDEPPWTSCADVVLDQIDRMEG